MPLKEQIKDIGRRLVEDRPDREALSGFVLTRKPLSMMFSDDGLIPTNPRFPVLLYRGAINVSTRRFKAATIMDVIFAENNWGRSWRDTVYDFVHYHSQVHEVLGVARGLAALEFGGPKGRVLTLYPGDVAVLPAGTGHRLIKASRGFQVVGAYPEIAAPGRKQSNELPRLSSRARTRFMEPLAQWRSCGPRQRNHVDKGLVGAMAILGSAL
jgi:uncharacterized protein YjlB